MRTQCAALREALAAIGLGALVWPFARVHTHMYGKVPPARERLAALLTLEVSRARVRRRVRPEVLGLRKSHRTVGARKRPGTTVRS